MKPGPAQVEMSTENTGTDRVISTEITAEVHEIAEQSPPFQNVSTAASPASVADIIELEPDCREVEAAPEQSDVDRQRVFIPLGSLLSQLKPDKSKNYSQTEANIKIPLFLIRPQLASGKILLSLKEFAGQLSPELNLAGLDLSQTVQLPLREILEQLPPEIIGLRNDQEIETLTDLVETPFTLQAQQDATAPNLDPAPSPESKITNDLSNHPESVERAKKPLQAHTPICSDLLRTIFMTEEELDLNKVVQKIAHLPGLSGACMKNLNGENLAGTFRDLNDPMFSVFANISRHARDLLAETSLGQLNALTFFAGSQQFSTFVLGPFVLTVSHDRRPFRPGVREQIQIILPELVRLNEC
ncbi:MAG: hypothetical protein JO076_06910 [Verrucomicrobia bacterium]|nr:hypothetical protein [Verrucomicrobiota bacterium]